MVIDGWPNKRILAQDTPPHTHTHTLRTCCLCDHLLHTGCKLVHRLIRALCLQMSEQPVKGLTTEPGISSQCAHCTYNAHIKNAINAHLRLTCGSRNHTSHTSAQDDIRR